MDSLASIENKCLSVRSRARNKTVPSFVRTIQKYFPNYFNDAVFTTHPILGQRQDLVDDDISVLMRQSALPLPVIRQATHYMIRLRYNDDAYKVFQSLLEKVSKDPERQTCALAYLREVNQRTLKGAIAVVHLAYLELGKDVSELPNVSKLYDDVRQLIVIPAMNACRALNQHVVYGLDRQIVLRPGCLIQSDTISVLTESVIWLISFSFTSASADHRLRLLTHYVLMGQPSHIKQVAVINPHCGIYSTIDISAIPEERLNILRDCLYGTLSLTKRALCDLRFEKRTVRQTEDFSLWYRMLVNEKFLPYPYISLLLSLAAGALEKGTSVDEMIDRLSFEREAIRNTGRSSGQSQTLSFIDTVLALFVVNEFSATEMVFVLAVTETLLRWFNRVSHFTRLSSMRVQAPMFQDPANDVILVQTNNQVALVKLNFDHLTTEGVEELIRQQVKLNNQPGVPLRQGMLKSAPTVAVVNPLLGEALCYETSALPSVVYDLIVSDLYDDLSN